MENRHCTSCANWFPDSGDSSIGECRRHAPYPRSVDEGKTSRQAAWPQTMSDDGCGEWYFGGRRGVEPSHPHIEPEIDTTGPIAGGRMPGDFGWCELHAQNPKGAKAFYESLFGWELRAEDTSTGIYSVIELNGRPIGGMRALPPDTPGKDARWGPYVSVANVDTLVTRAQELGGRALVAVQDIPGVGKSAVLEDPQGAVVGVISFLDRSR